MSELFYSRLHNQYIQSVAIQATLSFQAKQVTQLKIRLHSNAGELQFPQLFQERWQINVPSPAAMYNAV